MSDPFEAEYLQRFTPAQRQATRMLAGVWAQIASRFSSDCEFWVLWGAVQFLHSQEVMDASRQAYTSAVEFQKLLTRDDDRFVSCVTARRIYGDLGLPVPNWVLALEAEIAQRADDLRREIQADKPRLGTTPTPIEPVH